jgi:hypothetical protein
MSGCSRVKVAARSCHRASSARAPDRAGASAYFVNTSSFIASPTFTAMNVRPARVRSPDI